MSGGSPGGAVAAERGRGHDVEALVADRLAAAHAEAVAALLDPAERTFDFSEPATFVDQETGEEVPLEPWEVQASYQQKLGAWSDRYLLECRRQPRSECDAFSPPERSLQLVERPPHGHDP